MWLDRRATNVMFSPFRTVRRVRTENTPVYRTDYLPFDNQLRATWMTTVSALSAPVIFEL